MEQGYVQSHIRIHHAALKKNRVSTEGAWVSRELWGIWEIKHMDGCCVHALFSFI